MPDLALCGSGGTVLRQVFFGPEGTVTPLHSDPYENIFCQAILWDFCWFLGTLFLSQTISLELQLLDASHFQLLPNKNLLWQKWECP